MIAQTIPGKVVCVGWQKTGTKSVAKALSLLGYRTATWSPEFFYRWHEGKIDRLMRAAMGADAFDDFPWSLLFREFDWVFPDGRFILTVRPEDAWLRSLQAHMARTPRWVGHYLLYGSYDPVVDADRHVRTYREHNEAVHNHFRGSPGKFIELSFPLHWEPICAFLGLAVPNQPFPHENAEERPLISRGL